MSRGELLDENSDAVEIYDRKLGLLKSMEEELNRLIQEKHWDQPEA